MTFSRYQDIKLAIVHQRTESAFSYALVNFSQEKNLGLGSIRPHIDQVMGNMPG